MLKPKFGLTTIFTFLLIAILLITTKTSFLSVMGLASDIKTNSQCQEVIDEIRNGKRIVLLNNVETSEINHLVDLIYDEPDFFWLDMKYQAIKIGNISILSLKEKYSDVDFIQKTIDERATTIVSSLINENMSDYDKVLKIHDWICENVEYSEVENNGDQEVYGALFENKARCAGYSKLFSLLLQKAGIKSEVLSGTSMDSTGEIVSHAWNLAYLDGEPYYFDVTWDDSEAVGYHHHWFAVTKDEIALTHFPNDGYKWTEADSTKENYYIKQNKVMQAYSYKYIVNQIKETGKRISFKCASKEILDKTIAAITNEIELQKIMQETGIQSISMVTYECNEGPNCITILLE